VRLVLSEEQIRDGVADLSRQVTRDYRGRPLTVLGALTGSLVFLSDLIRQLDFRLQVGLIRARSYRGRSILPGALTIQDTEMPEIAGRDVLLLDDIFDTGRTLAGLVETLKELRPASLKTAVLLLKQGRSEVAITPDYYCFEIPDVFVVGYGLDYNDEYRHLPHVAALDHHEL